MAIWRITGMFSRPADDGGSDLAVAAQWEAVEQADDGDVPRYAQMMGTWTFAQPRRDAASDEDVLAWMVAEGFDRAAVEAQLLTLL